MTKLPLPALALSLLCALPRLGLAATPTPEATPMAAIAGAAPTAAADASDLVQRGGYLAQAGDCIACHTAPKGKPFAGGLPMSTPLGTIYSTNITPDSGTGIGAYSEADFRRALREGVAKDGHNLYPAMPYPSFAKLGDDDVHALYAYFMHGVTPVQQANRASAIPFPLNQRWPLMLWNLAFLHAGAYVPKPDHDAMWNRGAYLVQGLGHCGACHTPRGLTFQEQALDESGTLFLSGAVLDDWSAPNLSGNTRSGLGRWSEAQLVGFLKTGANEHATAFGSMTSVINHRRSPMPMRRPWRTI
jgi:mono/diheme cytochrome c family protein